MDMRKDGAPGILVLADGTFFQGEGFGASGRIAGEVVFNTSTTGHEEVLMDPAHQGQIVNLTHPVLGGCGVCSDWSETPVPHAPGVVVRGCYPLATHWSARHPMAAYMLRHGVVGLAGVDTRRLTRLLRRKGAMGGVLVAGPEAVCVDIAGLQREAAACRVPGPVGAATGSGLRRIPGRGARVLLLDCGITRGLVDLLCAAGCDLAIAPPTFDAGGIREMRPDGMVVAGGPGDPRDMAEPVETVRRMLGEVPVMGIGLGQQLLARALGAGTYRMRCGHRGGNYPVGDVQTGRVTISCQNHGYAVDEASLPGTGLAVTGRNLNDGSVEALRHEQMPAFAVQYLPRTPPANPDRWPPLDAFLGVMRKGGVLQ